MADTQMNQNEHAISSSPASTPAESPPVSQSDPPTTESTAVPPSQGEEAVSVSSAPPPSRRPLALLLLVAGVLVMAYGLWSMRAPAPPAPEAPVESSEPVPTETPLTLDLPQPVLSEPELIGKLFITAERQSYQNGEMTLRIPRLGVNGAVQSSTTDADLANGVGLFDYAQLPGEGNRNVSLAGHRDIKGCEFYYIDRLTPGDLFYLIYQDTIYVYQYQSTAVIEADDWSRIAGQGYSCITLVSCHPLGTTRQRIVVVGQLVQTVPYTEDYVFSASIPGQEKPAAWEDDAPTWEEFGGTNPAPGPADELDETNRSSLPV